jgi:hypothetical protein
MRSALRSLIIHGKSGGLCRQGYNCCLFAYGQTGSGKSYSMLGFGVNKGIVPQACEEIFKRIDKNQEKNRMFEVTVSMVEIYN